MAAYAIQFRRGTTTEHSSFTGLLGEVTVDTTKKTIVVHDGSTAGGFALALDGATTNTTTGAFSSNVTVGGTLGVTGLTTMSGAAAVTGNLTMTGHVLPSANVTYDLGSTSMMWRDVFIGPGSLYINGKKVIEDDSGTINISTDVNQDLKFTTSGTGTLKLIGANGINVTGELGAVSGDLQIGDHMDMNSNLIKELATPVSSTDAANKAYVDSTSASAVTGGSNAVSGTTGAFSSNVTVTGNLTVNGTTTSINTSQIDLADNILLLNSDATGSASVNAGIEVERGDDVNVQLLWNETDNRWDLAAEDLKTTGLVIADGFTGPVTGTVSSIANHTTADLTEGADLYFTDGRARAAISVSGDISYNSSTGVITTTGLASSDTGDLAEGSNLYYTNARADARITNALLDEDNMGSDSATHVPSQQSVVAYVASQIATKDNTDEMTEGSTNLYHTTARVDARTAVSTAANKLVWEAYADQAEADAESAAATDATTKADQALVDAKAYADTAETDAIASALSSAESKDVARMVTSDAYADQAEADAIASAESKDVARMVTSDAYTDSAVTTFESSLTHFHSAVQSVSAAEETDNTSSTTDYTFSELTNARHYTLFINRMLMRASEYSVSGTTVTINSGIIALDDELEVTGFSS